MYNEMDYTEKEKHWESFEEYNDSPSVAACLNLTYPSSLTDINKVKITGKKALTRCHL